MSEREIMFKRWINQHCAGYQIEQGVWKSTIIGGQVEMSDGSIKDAWYVEPAPPLEMKNDRFEYGFYPPAGPILFEKPHVDQLSDILAIGE